VIASGGVRNLEDLRRLTQLEAAGQRIDGLIVGREVTAGRFTVEEAKEVVAGGGPNRAPGGVMSTKTSIGVGSLPASLAFYGDVMGFEHVRSPSQGVVAAVVQAAPGQQIELIQGGSARPDSISLQVDDLERWKDHFASVGVASTAAGSSLIVVDPDGLEIRLESS
jgi:hypothetical protein